jgi:hypothetical protein
LAFILPSHNKIRDTPTRNYWYLLEELKLLFEMVSCSWKWSRIPITVHRRAHGKIRFSRISMTNVSKCTLKQWYLTIFCNSPDSTNEFFSQGIHTSGPAEVQCLPCSCCFSSRALQLESHKLFTSKSKQNKAKRVNTRHYWYLLKELKLLFPDGIMLMEMG